MSAQKEELLEFQQKQDAQHLAKLEKLSEKLAGVRDEYADLQKKLDESEEQFTAFQEVNILLLNNQTFKSIMPERRSYLLDCGEPLFDSRGKYLRQVFCAENTEK